MGIRESTEYRVQSTEYNYRAECKRHGQSTNTMRSENIMKGENAPFGLSRVTCHGKRKTTTPPAGSKWEVRLG